MKIFSRNIFSEFHLLMFLITAQAFFLFKGILGLCTPTAHLFLIADEK